jgi:hypothetical protein
MKLKQFKPFFIVILIFGGFIITLNFTSCDRDNCGSDAIDPPMKELSKWNRQRFPYFRYESLTFRIEEPGRIDTVTLQRTSVDSSVVKVGLGRDPHSGCYVGYDEIYKTYHIKYGERDNPDRLTMYAESTGGSLDFIWNENEIGFLFHSFNGFLGNQNDELNHDTVNFFGRDFYPTACGEQLRSFTDTVYGCYNYPLGIIFLHDYQMEKKWYLLEAHSY